MNNADISRGSLAIAVAELADPPIVIQAEIIAAELLYGTTQPRSWVGRLADWMSRSFGTLFGIASVIFLLAFSANVPFVQFMSLGYLLEVTGRLARGQRWRDALVGLNKAARIGAVVLGTWLSLLPVRFISQLWIEANLIDPLSGQTQVIRTIQIVLIGITIVHIVSVWICGAQLRYFFWPIVAPFSMCVWLLRRGAGSPNTRKSMDATIGWLAPGLVEELCRVRPITDWFVPAILYKKRGTLFITARDGLWDFVAGLNLRYYFLFGLKGFIGSFAWLVIPTLLLVAATSSTHDGVALVAGLLGTITAGGVFTVLPFLQAHFAIDGKLARFIQPGRVARVFSRAPIAHWLALFVTLLFALPLFLLKVEEIPADLLWTLSVVFVIFTWPARLAVGAAVRRGIQQSRPSRWWIKYPLISAALLLAMPVSMSFVVILFFTRYVTWHGALSLFENHVFLLPAPFWL
jgi:hypothetical protein